MFWGGFFLLLSFLKKKRKEKKIRKKEVFDWSGFAFVGYFMGQLSGHYNFGKLLAWFCLSNFGWVPCGERG